MKRVGNYGNRRAPIRARSRLVQQIFDAADRSGVYVKDVTHVTPSTATSWRSGRACPSVASIERAADRLGYEFVLVKKEPAE